MPMPSPYSPESRRQMAAHAQAKFHRQIDRVRPGTRTFEIVKRVLIGTYSDGFIHAGNLA
ncbi:MAG: ribonuclease BN, partial [bacterium]|nr:ribonuclease BN [bacterium]